MAAFVSDDLPDAAIKARCRNHDVSQAGQGVFRRECHD